MRLLDQLIHLSDAFGFAKGVGRQRVSTLVFNRGAKLDAIADGVSDLNTKTFERALLWFSDNWPDGADWPAAVPRPEPSCMREAGE